MAISILASIVTAKTSCCKWFLFGASIIRTIGYVVIVHLRGAKNSDVELFLVQAIQGVGSGVIQTVCVTAAQFQVLHVQTAQMTALMPLFAFLGSGVGASVAGGIYTNHFEKRLRIHMGTGTSESAIKAIYNSITSTLLLVYRLTAGPLGHWDLQS